MIAKVWGKAFYANTYGKCLVQRSTKVFKRITPWVQVTGSFFVLFLYNDQIGGMGFVHPVKKKKRPGTTNSLCAIL